MIIFLWTVVVWMLNIENVWKSIYLIIIQFCDIPFNNFCVILHSWCYYFCIHHKWHPVWYTIHSIYSYQKSHGQYYDALGIVSSYHQIHVIFLHDNCEHCIYFFIGCLFDIIIIVALWISQPKEAWITKTNHLVVLNFLESEI